MSTVESNLVSAWCECCCKAKDARKGRADSAYFKCFECRMQCDFKRGEPVCRLEQ